MSSPVKGNVVPAHAMKACGGVSVEFHLFLISVLDGDRWSASRHGRFIPSTQWIRREWVWASRFTFGNLLLTYSPKSDGQRSSTIRWLRVRTNEQAIPTCGSRTIRKSQTLVRSRVMKWVPSESVTAELPRCCDFMAWEVGQTEERGLAWL